MSYFDLFENQPDQLKVHILTSDHTFPPVESADEHGLLAIGGDLSVARLEEAYKRGIFPWYDASQPVLWWSPDPRMVLYPDNLKISKSMTQVLKKELFRVSFNQEFHQVIMECSRIRRPGQDTTWITPGMQTAYLELHRAGLAYSVEVWQNQELVGGLYGIYLKEKQVFCGESMFSKVSNASKFGFIRWIDRLKEEKVKLVDCQVYTPHLESLGGEEISRKDFMKYLE